jgi:hypothetical protein
MRKTNFSLIRVLFSITWDYRINYPLIHYLKSYSMKVILMITSPEPNRRKFTPLNNGILPRCLTGCRLPLLLSTVADRLTNNH